jgi:hypothetical protein
MTSRSIFKPPKTSTLGLSLVFAALSLLAHGFFVGWVGGVIETPALNQPIRGNPIEVSLSRDLPVPSITPSVDSIAKPPRPLAKSSKPRNVASKPTIATNRAVTDSGTNGDVALNTQAGETNRDEVSPTSEPLATTAKPESAQEIEKESAKEFVKDKPALAEPALYPGGLGAIPLAGAFPYTFYIGEFTLNNVLGAGSFIVEADEGKYKLVLIGKASGLTSLIFSGATYKSEGTFGSDGFAPQRYAEKSGNRPERAALVDYAAKEVALGDQKKPTLQGLQDRVSVIWQVGLILRAKPEYAEKGKVLPIPLMSTRSLENAQFISQGPVDFDKRGVLVKAVHFKFKPANPLNKAQIDLWYDLTNLPQPLRVRWIDERDRTLDIFRDD